MPWRQEVRSRWRSFAIANALRLALVSYLPLTIVAVYQWSTSAQGGRVSLALSVVSFLSLSGVLAFICFSLWRIGKREEAGYDERAEEETLARRWAILYECADRPIGRTEQRSHRRKAFYDLSGPLLAVAFAKAILVAGFQVRRPLVDIADGSGPCLGAVHRPAAARDRVTRGHDPLQAVR